MTNHSNCPRFRPIASSSYCPSLIIHFSSRPALLFPCLLVSLWPCRIPLSPCRAVSLSLCRYLRVALSHFLVVPVTLPLCHRHRIIHYVALSFCRPVLLPLCCCNLVSLSPRHPVTGLSFLQYRPLALSPCHPVTPLPCHPVTCLLSSSSTIGLSVCLGRA